MLPDALRFLLLATLAVPPAALRAPGGPPPAATAGGAHTQAAETAHRDARQTSEEPEEATEGTKATHESERSKTPAAVKATPNPAAIEANETPSTGGAPVAEPDFSAWLEAFVAEARAAGISERTLAALRRVRPLPRVIELDRRQPEGTMRFGRYLRHILGGDRVTYGRRLLAEERETLEAVARTYGVPPRFIVALWGIESSYGRNTGGFPVLGALATLAWEGRRARFFRGELLEALRILDEGHVTPEKMTGSWAGAMGQCQFMPSSFRAWAVDHDGDGRRDIWETRADVFASTANYLVKNGWRTGQTWGRRVELPEGFDPKLVGLEIQKPLSEWQALGVRRPGGAPLPSAEMEGSLVQPGGPRGPTYLVYSNYRVFLHWNRSLYFATAVGLLADRLAAP
ncbi:MAG: lytic murein transglycosylase [Deltaproteobacteria bacterium]|nr:MAG: lytic murein transglycosylase [Deltaproteobacteria bacterium]